MSAPRTPQEWYALFDREWDHIREIMSNIRVDYQKPFDILPKPLEHYLQDLRRNEDGKLLARHLNRVWELAPDKPYIHEWPGWGDLCDLCSECWVFEPEGDSK